jgi:hypothetical protein
MIKYVAHSIHDKRNKKLVLKTEKVKVKITIEQATKAQRGTEV